jgi:hypothetical protein
MRRFSFHCAMVVLVAAFTGCGGEALRVTSIDLGRSVNADSTIAAHSTTFEPGDTIYLSVSTAGVGSGTLGVRWMYGSRVVGEPTKQVSYKDDAATEFNLQSATGFPPGAYTAEVFLDGQSVGTRSFRVEQ